MSKKTPFIDIRADVRALRAKRKAESQSERATPEPKGPSGSLRCSGMVSWLDSTVDRFCQMSAAEFEAKGDTIIRGVTTITFTLCALAVLTTAAIHWILAS